MEKLYNLTNPQKSIWNTEKFFEGTVINNICGCSVIKEKIDAELLKKAINNIVQKNDSFRIKIVLENGIPMQHITEFKPFDIENIHIKDETELIKLKEEAVKQKIDILGDSLFIFKIAIFENGFGAILLTLNHIIADSWSMGLFVEKTLEEYYALKENTELTKELSYIDYIISEENYKKTDRYIVDKLYWEKVFKEIPDQVTLPSSKEINNSFLYEAKRIPFFLNAELVKKINEFCKTNKVSAFNFLMSIYSIYLSKVSNSENFVIGTPILNRANYREKQTMGMFINTVPVKISITQNENFLEFVHNFNSNMMSILKHQKYSYTKILEDIRNRENTNILNLYSVGISYQITKKIGNYTLEWVFNGCTGNDLDIHISDLNDTGELLINYDYLIEKYELADISNMHNHIVNMIEQVLENNESTCDEIEIITKEEKDKVLYEFNNTKIDYPEEKTIIDLFDEQVQKTPNNIALIFNNEKMSYIELNEKANSLAFYLINVEKIQKNDFVGIMMNRSLEMIVAILAVLKTGCTYIPMDPSYPEDRINYILFNSNAKVLLMQKKLKDKIDFANKVFVDLNNELYQSNKENIKVITSPEDLAYVIFTSGSTGNPKGVMIKQKNIVNFIFGMKEVFGFTDRDVIVSITTISFDIFVLETLFPLTSGLRVVIANENEQTNVKLFNELCKNNNVNIIQTTPSRMQTFIFDLKNTDFIKDATHILIGGEPFKYSLFSDIRKISNAKVFNMYGPTETAVWSTVKEIKDKNSITIGKPINNTQVYILDNNLKCVPIGVIGEIYISGDGVSKGYLNNQELTDNSFMDNPYVENTKMYKTGDLGKYLENGEIVCLGRVDNQVKIRGFRIELEEIEKRINELEFVKNCVVDKKYDNNNHECLCAYYISNTQVSPNEVKKHLKNYLPPYMIPQYILQVEEFPHTPNGKIDRKKLLLPQTTNTIAPDSLPRNNIDFGLIEILKDLLKVNNVNIGDNFFEIGGDSLSAIALCIKIEDKFNVQILVKEIFENPIVANISDMIITKNSFIKKIVIEKVPESESYEMSSAQKRIYYATQIAGEESILYNISGGVIFEGNVDVILLENCFKQLIERQESLRTYFELEKGKVVQKILKSINYKLDILEDIDFSKINDVFNSFVKPFNLSRGPLFRTLFIKFTNNKSALFIDMHHIISDGISLNVIINDICKLYNGVALPNLNISYKDFTYFDNSRINSEEFKETENYWLNQFDNDIPILNLPTNHQRPAVQCFEGKKVYFSIDDNYTKKINELCRKLEITPYMLLLACYNIMLSKYTFQKDIIVGSPVVGRDIADTYSLVGMFVNILAIRNKINAEDSFKNFLIDIKEKMLQSYKYQTYPFDELVSKLNIKRDTSRNPLFDTMFIYQNNGLEKMTFKDISAEYYLPDTNISKYDITLEAIPIDDYINFSFEYATKLFDESFIESMAEHYINILKVVLDNVDIKISNIEMISDDEKVKLLYKFNDTNYEYPQSKTVSQLFEEQVEICYDKVAIAFENQEMTYKELNEKANSLAYYLRNSLKVKRNDLIGIMTSRSIEMIVSILAVLKSGGCYIPIDPSYPKERIRYILENSNSKVLLTQKNLEENVDFEQKVNIDLNEKIYDNNKSNLFNVNKSDDLCYTIFTSGSTGRPKGVMISHKNIINFIYGIINILELPSEYNIAAITTISFDIFALESLLPLLNGMKIVLANEEEQINSTLFNELCENNKVDIIQATPSRLQNLLLNENGFDFIKKTKMILVGGESFPKELLDKIKENSNCRIFNMYGPTETTVWSSIKELTNSENITIGKPVSNTQMYILDKTLNPVPIGVVGEIYISGDGVSKGYLNNKDLTDASFISNPFLKGKLMYKTGDLGKYNENGEIKYISRIDNQVKIRGLRIELGEIESLILRHPYIKKVAVIKQTINNREFISAYYVTSKRIIVNELRKYLSDYLPRYMIPTYYIALDDLPYTPNGKIDRKSLPLPSEILSISKEKYVAPKTKLQKELVSIWEGILNTKPIGINDNFFELGGDSLLAMNLNIELLKFTKETTYQDIFNYPTIAELEDIINSKKQKSIINKFSNLNEKFINILKKCTIRQKTTKYHSKNILLTGATGFLGIHILDQFLKRDNCNIYCIVHEEPGITSRTKLFQKLNYYFGNKYNDLLDKRIIAVPGDVTKPGFGLNQDELLKLANNIEIVINSAAKVSHYGNYSDFYNTNVKSVRHIIDFCKSFKKKFYQVSTISVSGRKFDKDYNGQNKNDKIIFNESNLYVGQNLDNVYVYSKFEAETLVLGAISEGLDGYILRMGNLMPRFKDGVFQENIKDNAFLNKIVSFAKLGMFPDYIIDEIVEITPVDNAANTIFKIITHPNNDNRIFHLYNHKYVPVKKIIKVMNKLKHKINIVPEEIFTNKINEVINNKREKDSISGIINDLNDKLYLDYKLDIKTDSKFTVKYLFRLLFIWPRISTKYIKKLIELLWRGVKK